MSCRTEAGVERNTARAIVRSPKKRKNAYEETRGLDLVEQLGAIKT
jgi:hypothetical protein